MRQLIHSTIEDVSKKERVTSKVLQTIVDRQINTEADWSKITTIITLGLDEIALRKGHQSYLTEVSARSKDGRLSIIGVLNGRFKEDVQSFLESMPAHLKETVNSVCTDMYDGFVNAAIEVFGVQPIVVDRYHVAKLYRKVSATHSLIPKSINPKA